MNHKVEISIISITRSPGIQSLGNGHISVWYKAIKIYLFYVKNQFDFDINTIDLTENDLSISNFINYTIFFCIIT